MFMQLLIYQLLYYFLYQRLLIYKIKIVLLLRIYFSNFISILITSLCPKSTDEELGIKSRPIWTCDVSSFEQNYVDKEICLMIEGKVTVMPEKGQPVNLNTGELISFPAAIN